jgi:SAM-dependent methyltransferase
VKPRSTFSRYGIDAPYVPALLGGAGVVCLVAAVALRGQLGLLIPAVILLASAASYLYATLIGKFRAWEKLLDQMQLAGTEQLADLGCGRGAVLLAAARRLPGGRARGLDLWRSIDQSGNAESVTRANADAAGLSDRVELLTGDMTALPFDDASLDAVTSSLAIHNIKAADGRARVLDEALRVLRPGGRLCIADIRHAKQYGEHLRLAGAVDVRVRNLGPQVWFGGPWMMTSAVVARKADAPVA